jgi:two-component system NtrC family sensor kinase
MPNEHILLLLASPETNQYFESMVLTPAGFRVSCAADLKAGEILLKEDPPDLIILSDHLDGHDFLSSTVVLHRHDPFVPVLMLPESHSEELAISAFKAGLSGYIRPPVQPSEMLQSVQFALDRRKQWVNHARLLAKRDTKSLQRRVNGLETIERVGRKVTSILDLDSVLTMIVDAAVDLTGAEEGSLLLLDESSGELFMRASRNFQEEFVKTFRLPIQDTLAGQVLRTGKPILLDEKIPKKIKTAYLVYTLIYMPITLKDRVIGVLEVDNRQSGKSFSEYHMTLLSALSDYAAIALENARHYSRSETERNKLEAILTGIEDGVIVVGTDGRLILINRKAREAFDIEDVNLTGKRLRDLIHHQEFLEVLRDENLISPMRVELVLENTRVMNTQITPIEGIGLVVIMQDITHLKELDRIKTDFVNTVSHDLRSPLTAILGYVELIDRVGPVNKQQLEFIRRVQLSVHSITSLINDLLDLGRIEAGFDARKEIVPFSTIIYYSVDGLRNRAAEKSQLLNIEIPERLPQVLGNPLRLRQMVSNLLANAIKYTQESGEIRVSVRAEAGQIIMRVSDNGLGIPPADQPYIFDKFYRASNVSNDTPGSGLGLAIVKSIVENHLGRIWVDSTLSQGTTFTVVFPIAELEI